MATASPAGAAPRARRLPLALYPFLYAVLCALPAPARAQQAAPIPPGRAPQAGPLPAGLLDGLRFRAIGPAVVGGRIHDVEALPRVPSTIYVATATGGLWKSTNKGTTWTPLFDDQPVSTFGDVAIAPSDPNVVWAGTGEQNNRQSSSWGNGVYRSTDGGRTWTHLGLEGTRHIGRIRVHPRDPNTAYVAALGNLWAPSADRGVYKTTDGGRTWQKVLYVDTLTGVVDLAMDPSNPDVLYAAAYQRLRRAWGFNGGGPGSGIYKTTDGGRTWRRLERGIPAGDKGRIGLALAESDPRVLVATIEHATEGGVYRSEDGGETWERVNRLNPRPMYYSHISLDPTNPQRVYVLGVSFYRSDDGGRTFRTMPTAPTYDVGTKGDFHALWIDPNDPRHLYLAGDGGLHESWDAGVTFIRMNNLPIAQFYAIGVDMRDPYWIAGGLQDNHSWMVPSRTRHWEGILDDDWRQVGFGDGMYHQFDPSDPRVLYSVAQNGEVQRVDTETGDRLDIRPYPPPGEPPYRFDWVTPLLVSRHDPRTIYLGGNRLFISRDRGVSWERTEDLTRRIDRDTLLLMGVRGREPMLSKNDGEQSFGEITTIAESPLDPRVLWVGTDDGNVQVSRDGGRTWTEVSRRIRGAPDGATVSRVVASAASPATAYVAFDAHRDGDLRPYVFRTTDFGQSWTSVVRGLPESGPVNALVEHPANPNVLFLGTEHALYVSADAGAHWTRFKANLPTTLVDDIVVHPRELDLIVATHGRGLYILDDARPLAEWSPAVAAAPAHLFSVRDATIYQYWKDTSYRGQAAWHGENPPEGAILTYYLGRPARTATITITDAAGRTVRRLQVPATPGVLHRVSWDLRHEPPPFDEPGDEEEASGRGLPVLPRPVTPRGPFVSPGRYTATLEADGARSTRTFTVRGDPLLALTDAEWREREAFLLEVLELQRKAWDAAERAGALRRRLAALRDSAAARGAVPATLAAQLDSVSALARRLGAAGGPGGGGGGGLRQQIYRLAGEFNGNGVRQGSLFPPTRTHRERKAQLEQALTEALAALAREEARAPRGVASEP